LQPKYFFSSLIGTALTLKFAFLQDHSPFKGLSSSGDGNFTEIHPHIVSK